jgi:ABC-type Zn uptake system ZnuABC Zn-binding protein ZnuA
LHVGGFAHSNPKTEPYRTDRVDGHIAEHTLPHIDEVQLEAGQRLSVVASTSIVADVVANVGGDTIQLTTLIEPGQDPHGYEPTPSALAAVEMSHVVFVNGFGLEEGLLESIETTAGGVVVAVSAGIEPLAVHTEHHDEHMHHEDAEHDQHEEEHHEVEHMEHDEHVHEHGPVDPHVWFDPANVMVWVENIEHVLSGADPSNSEIYHEQAEVYLKNLETLDTSMRETFATLPDNRKKIVTDHHIFSYFAKAYGFDVVGAVLPSGSSSVETSARQIAELVEVMRREGVYTIFVGRTAGRGMEKLAASVAAETGEDVNVVELLTGSLSSRGTEGDTYLGYMEYNMGQIMGGLER